MTEDSCVRTLWTVAAVVLAGCARAEEPREAESERLLPEKVRELARKELAGLEGRATLVVFTQEFECRSCKENTRLAREVADLSDKIRIEVFDFKRDKRAVEEYEIDKIPAIAVVGRRDYGVRFYGVPGGYEFRAFLDAIKQVSKGDSGLSEASRIALKQVDRPVHIQVFVSPTWPYCPGAVALSHKLAIESEFITADAVAAGEFAHLAVKYGVRGVPKTVMNETVEILGAKPEHVFVSRVLEAASE